MRFLMERETCVIEYTILKTEIGFYRQKGSEQIDLSGVKWDN